MVVQTPLNITRSGNCISVEGDLSGSNYLRLLAVMHQATQGLGYKDLILDFSRCVAAFPASMLGVCSQIIALRSHGFEVALTLPTKDNLRKLFDNSNWAHLIDPISYERSHYRGYSHVPATQFISSAEQQFAVNSIIDVLMKSLTGMQRSDFAAIEWSLNEITDNVLTHARAENGGLVQVTTFEKVRRRVEFVVCDAGATIPGTLRETHAEIRSDLQALEQAIREGITRDKSLGQGNGLFGSLEICRVSGGNFHVHSRRANLSFSGKKNALEFRHEQIPFSGTLVVASIDCSRPGILQTALKFGGTQHVPIDFIETRYELHAEEAPRFIMYDEAVSFGARLAGEAIRRKLTNVVSMVSGRRLVIDFQGVPLVSSSFADEVFGKLFLEMGPVGFAQRFEIVNVSQMVRSLIDKAIAQRISSTAK